MPNHIHLIIFVDSVSISNKDKVDDIAFENSFDERSDAMNRVSANATQNQVGSGGVTRHKNPMLKNGLSRLIRWLKGSSTYYAHQQQLPLIWQSRFYDRIIRNQDELNRIAEYIENNIDNWKADEYNV